MKKWVLITLGMGVVAGGALLAPAAYRHWRQRHLIHQAREFLAKSDTANARLCLRRAVQCNPSDIEACRMFAGMAEQAGSPNAIWWRHRVVELEPKALQNRI